MSAPEVPGRAVRVMTGEDQQRAAQLVVCNHARDADDAALLLDVLGLLPDPTNLEDRR